MSLSNENIKKYFFSLSEKEKVTLARSLVSNLKDFSKEVIVDDIAEKFSYKNTTSKNFEIACVENLKCYLLKLALKYFIDYAFVTSFFYAGTLYAFIRIKREVSVRQLFRSDNYVCKLRMHCESPYHTFPPKFIVYNNNDISKKLKIEITSQEKKYFIRYDSEYEEITNCPGGNELNALSEVKFDSGVALQIRLSRLTDASLYTIIEGEEVEVDEDERIIVEEIAPFNCNEFGCHHHFLYNDY